MAVDSPDCSLAAAIFSWLYTFVNAVLFFMSIYTFYRFCKDYRTNPKKRPPKLLYYPGLIFFIFCSLALLATVRNAMAMCYHGDTSYQDFYYWIYFIAFYGVQTYLLWLVLFLRLHYVFKSSAYKLSKITIRIYLTIFIFVPFATPFYFIVLWFVDGVIYTIILLLSFIFIIVFSCSLSVLFVCKLFQVFNNMDLSHIASASSSSLKYQQKMVNNKLLQTITKSCLLAIISLTMTLLTPITLLFGYYAISKSHVQTVQEAGSCLLAFASLGDVWTNYMCILLSYNCFDPWYAKLCGKIDRKGRVFCIKKLMKRNRKMTKSGHLEISSVSSAIFSSKRSMDSITPTQITPPNGGDSRGRIDPIYEQVDTDLDYDETMEMTRDTTLNCNMPTPYAPEHHNGNFEYDNIPEDLNEEDEFEEEEENGDAHQDEEDEDEEDEDEDETRCLAVRAAESTREEGYVESYYSHNANNVETTNTSHTNIVRTNAANITSTNGQMYDL